jgi:MFS family permease
VRYPYADLVGLPNVPRLLTAAVIGRLPVGMGAIALFLLVRDSGGSYAMAGFAVGASTIAGCVGAPVLGRLVDRHGQPRILVPSMLAQVAALGLLALLAPPGGAVLLVLCAAYGFFAPPLAASLRATWAQLLPDRSRLQRAYSLDSTAQETIWIMGPVLAASVAAAYDARLPLVLMAGFVGIGVLWFATSPTSRGWRAERSGERHLLGPLQAGPVRRVLLAILGLAFAWGSLELAIAALADSRGENPGLLLSIWAVGSVAGGLAFAARRWRGSAQRMLVILLALNFAGFLVLPLAGDAVQLGVLLAVTGVVNAPVIATLYTLIEELSPRGTVTEAFTWVSTTFLAGISAGVALSGIISDVYGPKSAFVLAILGGGAAVLAVVLRHRGLHPLPHQVADGTM